MNNLVDDLGEVGRNGQHVRQPGSNPNKDNAQRRKSNRPRTKNSQPIKNESSDSFRWVDPLPVVDPIAAVMDTNIESVPAGYIDENFELPRNISKPFCDAIETVLDRTNLPADVIEETRNKLEAVSFYKAARQLYSTLSDPVKSRLQPLKAVFYDKSQIPTHMGSALGMIGNLETKFGVIEVSHPTVLFKRWVLAGLNIDPDVPDINGLPPENVIWRDRESKLYLDVLARRRIAEIRDNNPFVIAVAGNNITVQTPEIPISDAGYTSIVDEYPQADTLRDLVALLQMSPRTFSDPAGAIPHRRDLNAALNHLGLVLAPNNATVPGMRERFEQAMETYLTLRLPHIQSVFFVGEPPATGTGYGAQLVSSDRNVGRFSMPISDADKALGYMFNPCSGFELNPRFIIYGRRSVEQTAASFASADFRHLAKD